VVTTPNRGGRDDFFDEENSIEVASEPEAVAAGVRTMIERRIDPWAIREKTLVSMADHKARLAALVEDFQRAHGVAGNDLLSKAEPMRMKNGFTDKLD
jgi:broad specificity phosphatase PhoE